MSKKQIKFLIPLGALLLTLVMLAGCRPSEALTRLMNAINALNPATEEMKTEEEQEEDKPDDNMDPIDEERDDAMLEETEELIGQMLDDMDEETADQALDAIYSATATSNEWGVQQYNPDRIIDAGSDSSALARYIRGNASSSASGSASGTTNDLTDAAGTVKTNGVISSDGTESEDVDITPTDSDGDGKGGGTEGVVPAVSPSATQSEESSPSPSPSEELSPSPSPSEESSPSSSPNDNPNDGTGHYIAATGQAAIAVCMLGGSDRLVATSQDFVDNGLAQRAWNSDGSMDDCQPLWSGDGSTSLNETDFQTLLNLHPDLVVEVSGKNTITQSQYERLGEAGIAYFAMDDMKSQSSINSGLSNLAKQMDQSEGGTEAQDIASEYIEWCNSEISNIAKYATNYAETVFIEDWDPEVETRFNIKSYNSSTYHWEETGESVPVLTGAAEIRVGRSFRALTDYLLNANVYDWSASPHIRCAIGVYMGYPDAYGYGERTATGNIWYETRGTGTALFQVQPGKYCYVTPVYDRLDGTTYGGTKYQQQNSLYFSGGRSDTVGVLDTTDSIYSPYENNVMVSFSLSFGNLCIGYNDNINTWDTVIVKNQYIKGELDNNSAWKTNDNTGTFYKTLQAYQSVNYYCTPWPLSGSIGDVNDMSYNTSIGNKYTVYVNPTGLGDWVEGSPESILESVWAAWQIQDAYGETAAKSRIKNFYRTFYNGLELSDNDMATILAGPEN